MIYLKTAEDIELMRISNRIVAMTLGEIAKAVKPGVTTLQLDALAEDFIRSQGAVPSFLGYAGYPNSICTSVNDQVVHAIPSKYVLKEGDVVSVDCGAQINGFHGDSCYTFCVGEVSEEVKRLMKTTKESLMIGISNAKVGNRLGDVSHSIQEHCEGKGYSVVRELTGHGIGRMMHEEPLVQNYGRARRGLLFREGIVIAIEPIINMGKRGVYLEKDGWTVRTADGLPSAHFEHTVAIGTDGPDILSSFEYVEQILGTNAL
ncbi:MAG: type I methionyl aminopeptidase [Paludibacteraceae bacterium]|nr:type I methionyl aminopeptidase [Paludibacteraceae bacterium]